MSEAAAARPPTYSVCQFFIGGRYEYVRRYVPMEEASKAYVHYTSNVASRLGLVERVIVTDGGDCIVCEWKKGEGYVFPPEHRSFNKAQPTGEEG